MDSIGKKIRMLREKEDLTQAELGDKLGLSDKAVSTWEKDVKTPRMPTLKKIAEFFNVPVSYIIGETNSPSPKNGENKSHSVKIPVMGGVAAGAPITAVQEYIDVNDPDTYEEISEEKAASGVFFALRIAGDSMEPKISKGDIVIVRQQSDIKSGEIGIVLIGGNDATCKRIKKTPEGLYLISNNPAYEPMFYTQKQVNELPVSIIGKVVELRAKF